MLTDETRANFKLSSGWWTRLHLPHHPCNTELMGNGFYALQKSTYWKIAIRNMDTINLSRGMILVHETTLSSTMVVSVANFMVLIKPQFQEPENLENAHGGFVFIPQKFN